MSSFQLITDHPIALDSRDHIVPGGTMMDNTNHPEFLQKMYGLFPNRPFALMDLGCSSGRMVEQVLDDSIFDSGNSDGIKLHGHTSESLSISGHEVTSARCNRTAIGLDGSDYSLARQRESWGRIPDHLFVCDISQPFRVISKHVVDKLRQTLGMRKEPNCTKLRRVLAVPAYRFDVITCWEVMEHIPEDRLSQLVANVLEHLMPDGIWAMSISSQSGYHHRTLRDRPWWLEFFESHGLVNDHKVTSVIGQDWPRGPQEPNSFNLALRRKIQEPEV